jgi:hypothetical protein
MTTDAAERNSSRILLVLWAGAVIPLVAWGAHLAFIYLFASILCNAQTLLYALTLAALVIDVIAGIVAWRGYRTSLGKPHAADWDVIRARYFGLLGVSSSVIFAVGIVGQTISFLSDCR